MFDVGQWFWFFLRVSVYVTSSIVVFLILIIGVKIKKFLFCFKPKKNILKNQLKIRSFVFNTLSFEICENETIRVEIQISPTKRELTNLMVLNCENYSVRNVEIEDEQMKIDFDDGTINLTIKHSENLIHSGKGIFHCYDFIWSSVDFRRNFSEKISLIETGFWYGGATKKRVLWPINQSESSLMPMVPNDAYKNQFGNVSERYWLSSMGLGVLVDPLAGLFVSMDRKNLTFFSAFRSTYRQKEKNFQHRFHYKIFQHENFRDLHLSIIDRFLGKPKSTVDPTMMIEPIWSTWAQFKQKIDEEKLLRFAQQIADRDFPRSQISIDDDWTPRYGQFEFDRKKFPEPKKMIEKLKSLGFRVTLWVHPFVSFRSSNFLEFFRRGFLVETEILSTLIDELVENFPLLETILENFRKFSSRFSFRFPGICLWWNGLAAILDLTKPIVREDFLERLEKLKEDFSVDSFKFDAGEVVWLPFGFRFSESSCQSLSWNQDELVTSPAIFPHLYANLAAQADSTKRLQEVRVGYRTQNLPIFVRLIDKDSNWSYENGIKSILPSIFNLSLLGYPFVLPDMVGGNGYGATITQTRLPERQLYIRWLQLNVLLPAIQFSFPPWLYEDEEIVEIARRCLKIRQKFRSKILTAAENAVKTGEPIVRPLWFADPDNVHAQLCDNQYLLGDDVLVAPILEENLRQISIYFPRGRWKSISDSQIYQGGKFHDLPVTIEDIPIFERC